MRLYRARPANRRLGSDLKVNQTTVVTWPLNSGQATIFSGSSGGSGTARTCIIWNSCDDFIPPWLVQPLSLFSSHLRRPADSMLSTAQQWHIRYPHLQSIYSPCLARIGTGRLLRRFPDGAQYGTHQGLPSCAASSTLHLRTHLQPWPRNGGCVGKVPLTRQKTTSSADDLSGFSDSPFMGVELDSALDGFDRARIIPRSAKGEEDESLDPDRKDPRRPAPDTQASKRPSRPATSFKDAFDEMLANQPSQVPQPEMPRDVQPGGKKVGTTVYRKTSSTRVRSDERPPSNLKDTIGSFVSKLKNESSPSQKARDMFAARRTKYTDQAYLDALNAQIPKFPRISASESKSRSPGLPQDRSEPQDESMAAPSSVLAEASSSLKKPTKPAAGAGKMKKMERASAKTGVRSKRERAGLVRKNLASGEDPTNNSLGLFDQLESTPEVTKSPQTPSPIKHAEQSAVRLDSAISIMPRDISFEALDLVQPSVPKLAHDLDRVLFNRGVYNLQDRHSGVYNFDPYLENIMSVDEFDFNALREYKTSSKDPQLAAVARKHNTRYLGSTSSMTSMLTHFHYLISRWRPLYLDGLSKGFKIADTTKARSFTEVYRAPAAIFLRYKGGQKGSADQQSSAGMYAIDADKEFSSPNILMALGHSLEKLLTQSPSSYERYRKSDPREIPASERDATEAYHFSKQGDLLMRSQLDAYDSRLPGSGVFDLKTRAVLPVRMSAHDHEDMVGYQILSDQGDYESYERELYDMYRSTFLKYSLQVRMGRMEGIFIAYHNVEEIFGFQFMNLSDMDQILHDQKDSCLGDQEFRASLAIVNRIFNEATAEHPETSLRFHFDTSGGVVPMMYIFAEPMEEREVDALQEEAEKDIKKYEDALRGVPKAADSEEVGSSAPEEGGSIAEVKHSEDRTPNGTSDVQTTDPPLPDDVSAPGTPSATPPSPQDVTTSYSEAEHDSDGDGAPDTTSTRVEDPLSPTEGEPLSQATKTRKPLMAWTLTSDNIVNRKRVVRPENLTPEDVWEIRYDLRRIPEPERAWSFYETTKARRRRILSFDEMESAQDGGDEVGIGGWRSKKAVDPADIKAASDMDGEGKLSGQSIEEAMKGNDDGGNVAGGSGKKKARRAHNEYYLNMLRALSLRGRGIRDERLRKAEGQKKVVLGPVGGRAAGEQDGEVVRSAGERVEDLPGEVEIRDVDDYLKWIWGQQQQQQK